MRKNVAILVVTAMILTMASGFLTPSSAESSLKDGDYIQFGTYNNLPITWRVVDFDSNGNPMILSKGVICDKAFDAVHLSEADTNRDGGSNNWKQSNIRAWLNSSADAGKVTFPCGNPPTDKLLNYWVGKIEGLNGKAYDQEAGFLSDNNFTETERSFILEVTQKSMLNQVDKNLADGGTELFKLLPENYTGPELDKVDSNFNNAYYQNVTDRVFLLDINQAATVSKKYGNFAAVSDNGVKHRYYLRTPSVVAEDLVDVILVADNIPEPCVFDVGCLQEKTGIRPAMYLDISKIDTLGGKGTESNPYAVTEKAKASESSSNDNGIKITINKEYVLFNANSGAPFIDKANRTQVPLRVTMESYGATVSWDSTSKTAIVEKNGIKVEVPVGKSYIAVNGQNQTIDTSAQIVSGKTYLPIKSVIAALGGVVSWDQATKTVMITEK